MSPMQFAAKYEAVIEVAISVYSRLKHGGQKDMISWSLAVRLSHRVTAYQAWKKPEFLDHFASIEIKSSSKYIN